MTVSLVGEVLKKTGMAVLVRHGAKEETWIPFSVIEDPYPDGYEVDDTVEFHIQEWFAIREGLDT